MSTWETYRELEKNIKEIACATKKLATLTSGIKLGETSAFRHMDTTFRKEFIAAYDVDYGNKTIVVYLLTGHTLTLQFADEESLSNAVTKLNSMFAQVEVI